MGVRRGNSDEQTKNVKSVRSGQKAKGDTSPKKKPDAAAEQNASKAAEKGRTKPKRPNKADTSKLSIKIDIVYWEKSENLELIEGWARQGLSIEQIAENMGISRRTLYNWSRKSLRILHSLRESKLKADTHVENALYMKCIGYIKELTKPMKVKRTDYDPETGKKICDYDEIVYVKEETYVQPDTAAIKYYLSNRQPEKWREKVEHVIDTESEVGGVIVLPQVLEKNNEPTADEDLGATAQAD